MEPIDAVPRNPAATAFRQRLRLRQARWRESRGLPIGHQPIRGGRGARLLGSHIEFEYAVRTGANLLTPGALDAARARVAAPERGQMLKADRLWASLLSSMPLCFNLFGDLRSDLAAADRAVHAWWPDVPGRVSEVRFEWSPRRLDPLYLGNRTAFDAALLLELPRGREGVIGIETKYHEIADVEKPPPSRKLNRYRQVTEYGESEGIFRSGAVSAIVGSERQQLWLDHLLALAMRLHPHRRWEWARFVVVYPAENGSVASAVERYRETLLDDRTFLALTLERLLETPYALSSATAELVTARYLGDSTREPALSQRVTETDLERGQIRFPRPAKRFFPWEKGEVGVVLRGRRLLGRFDPRTGPDRERSAVLRVGRDALRLVHKGERLKVSKRGDGLVNLD